MKKLLLLLTVLFILTISNLSYSTELITYSYIESYKTNLNTAMISPNVYFNYGILEGFGFCDIYIYTIF